MHKQTNALIVTELALIHEILLTVPSQREMQLHLRQEGEDVRRTPPKTAARHPH